METNKRDDRPVNTANDENVPQPEPRVGIPDVLKASERDARNEKIEQPGEAANSGQASDTSQESRRAQEQPASGKGDKNDKGGGHEPSAKPEEPINISSADDVDFDENIPEEDRTDLNPPASNAKPGSKKG